MEAVLYAGFEQKKETKNPPLLYNLAELQNDCSKLFKISPDETLKIVQELYEKKLVTYPRTDARVLSTQWQRRLDRNIGGSESPMAQWQGLHRKFFPRRAYKEIGQTRYTNDKQITDHYAIIPTGQGLGALEKHKPASRKGLSGYLPEIFKHFLSACHLPEIQSGFRTEEGAFFCRL